MKAILMMFGFLALLVAVLVVVSVIKMSRKISRNTALLNAHRKSKEEKIAPSNANASSKTPPTSETKDNDEGKTATQRNFRPS